MWNKGIWSWRGRCKTALVIFCLLACEMVAQAQQPDLSALNSDDQSSIELACVIAKTNGPATYHACLQNQLRAMSGSSIPDLSGLNSGDQSSIELACVIAKTNGPAAYHACLQKQLQAMSGSSTPDLSRLNSDDQSSIELACVIAKTNGPATYHACLQKQLQAMSGSSIPDSSRLNSDYQSSRPDATRNEPSPTTSGTGLCAENGSCYGDPNANGVPKTVHVNGYYRKDGTYVRGHYRSAPGTNPRK